MRYSPSLLLSACVVLPTLVFAEVICVKIAFDGYRRTLDRWPSAGRLWLLWGAGGSAIICGLSFGAVDILLVIAGWLVEGQPLFDGIVIIGLAFALLGITMILTWHRRFRKACEAHGYDMFQRGGNAQV